MLSLTDLQARVAHAVIMGNADSVSEYLAGGADPRRRLGIHRRHYETSLVTALCDKFPATAWLAGADVVAAAAREYIRAHPPSRPCIAEYGGGFAEFLSSYGRATAIPYLKSFADLERAVGEVSIAVDFLPLQWSDFANAGPERLLDLKVRLQPGLRYVYSAWGVDELMTMYLEDAQHETFVMSEVETFVEIRGARGVLSIARIDPATFAFRVALSSGDSIASAADSALERDATFDAGGALQQLALSGLATELSGASEGVGA
jgi:hypothetical protein